MQSVPVRLVGRLGRSAGRLAGAPTDATAGASSVATREAEVGGVRCVTAWGEFHRLGVRAAPVVVLVQFLFGTALALQVYFGVTLKGYVGGVVAQNVFRWVGPLATAMVLAGFAGAAIAAEAATGKAGRTAGGRRVAPRVLALAAAAPLLNGVGQLAGLVGGWFISVAVLHVSAATYWQRASEYLLLKDVVLGVVKSACAGALIAAVACRAGSQAGEAPEEVGRAVQRSVGWSLSAVVVLECVWFRVFYLNG